MYFEPDLKSFLKRTVSAQLHFAGLIAAAVGLIVLLRLVHQNSDHNHFLACLIFGVTGMLVFAVSTVFHFMSDGFKISAETEAFMENLDHFAIFLFIAGTYTPFILNTLASPWREILLWIVWSVAVSGIIYTILRPRLPAWAKHRFVNTAIFVLMGWLLVMRIGESFHSLTSLGAFFLLAGAVSYSLGAVVYATKRPDPFPGLFGFHEIWHVMVLGGFAFHYFMILNFYR